MHNLVILGASGSIGQSTLKVLRHNPGRWQVLALTAARSVDAMLRDCLEFSPRFAVMVDEAAASRLARELAAMEELDEPGALEKILDILRKAAAIHNKDKLAA